MKPLCAAIAGITPPKCICGDTDTREEGANVGSIEAHGRMAATSAPVDPAEVNAALDLSAAEDAAAYEEGEI